MKCLYRLLACLLGLLPFLSAAETIPNAAILAEAGCDVEEAELYSLLGKETRLALVERGQLDILFREQALKTTAGNNAVWARVMAVDFLFHVRKDGKSVHVDIVDAQSGQWISDFPWGQVRGRLPALLENVTKKPNKTGLRAVVLERGGGRTLEASAAIREFLGSTDIVVLDRQASRHVAVEQGLAANGASDADIEKIAPMLGADLLISVRTETTQLSLTILDVAHGQIKGEKSFSWKSKADLPTDVQTWLLNQFHLPEEKALRYFPEIQIEALEPFYRGIREYRGGQWDKAAISFQEAFELNDKFADALLWEGLCYDAMGFPKMAQALRRYAQYGLVGQGVSIPLGGEKAEGLIFLGVSGQESGKAALASALALNALLEVSRERVLLPENLAAWRQEYDALVGVSKTKGGGWARAPRFFVKKSLHGSIDRDGNLRWSLIDNNHGKVLGMAQTRPLQGKQDLIRLQESLAALLSQSQANAETTQPNWTPGTEWGGKENATDNKIANVALLALLKTDPGNPLLWGAQIKRDGDYGSEQGKLGLEGIMNFAFRDELLSRLPEKDGQRPWLELCRIASFLPWNAQGVLCSGEKPDVQELLSNYIKKYSGSAAGAMALYMLQYEKLDSLSFEEIAQNWEGVVQAMRSAPDFSKVNNYVELTNMAEHIRDLGLIASGNNEKFSYLPVEPWPHRIQPTISSYGHLGYRITSYWLASEWSYFNVPRKYWQQEAGAALQVIYGRQTNTVKLDAKWIQKYPDSCVFLCFAVKVLHEVDHPRGRKPLYPFETEKEYRNYKELVHYCRDAIPRLLQNIEGPSNFNEMAALPRRFVTNLQRFNYATQVSDDDFAQIQKEMGVALDSAAVRLSQPPNDALGTYWRTMPRYFPPPKYPFWFFPPPEDVGDPEDILQREKSEALISFTDPPVVPRSWHDYIRGRKFVAWITREARAGILAGHQEKIERLYNRGSSKLDVRGFVLDFAIMLFEGGRMDLAEPWFSRVASSGASSTTPIQFMEREVVLNAKLYQAYCLARMKREVEALALATEVLEASNGQSYGMIAHFRTPQSVSYHYGNEGRKLSTLALRLLRELRFPELARTEPQMRVVDVDTPNSPDKSTRFYFRLPRGSYSKDQTTHILLFTPSWNHSGPEYIFGNNTWTRYCDQHNLALCAPDFNGVLENDGGHYQDAHDWSGKATLDAIAQAATWGNINAEKILVYGYGGGGRFAAMFGRFAPERCLAVAAFGVGYFGMPDHLPLSSPLKNLAGIPFAVSIGEADGMPDGGMGRYTEAMADSSKIEYYGANLVWRSWPGLGHWPTPQMERLAQTFFVQAMRPESYKNWKSPPYIGDRRSGEVFKKGDARIEQIPKNWRQPLCGKELAEAWEGK